jgi:hypothetical protein
MSVSLDADPFGGDFEAEIEENELGNRAERVRGLHFDGIEFAGTVCLCRQSLQESFAMSLHARHSHVL